QEGQQFRLVDPPSLPSMPSSPKRLKICLGALLGGLALGLGLAFLKDLRIPAFYSEKEVSQKLGIPLVVGIPLLLTSAQQRAQPWKRVLESVSACVLVVALCLAEFYVYRHG